MPRRQVEVDKLVEAMKRAAARCATPTSASRSAAGLAAWARGGPATDHDVDFFVKPEDAEAALEASSTAGLRAERPPEDWLLKAFHDDTLVDLIFRPAGGPVTDELLDRAEEREVMAMPLPSPRSRTSSRRSSSRSPSRSPTSAACSRSRARCASRSDWDDVRERTNGSPFAKAFFTLIDELGIVERAERRCG